MSWKSFAVMKNPSPMSVRRSANSRANAALSQRDVADFVVRLDLNSAVVCWQPTSVVRFSDASKMTATIAQTQEICGNYCQRSAVCIFNECAPGTLPEDYTRGCFETCVENPPEGRELQRFFNQTCAEAVAEIRGRDELINNRCDAEEEEACETLCEDRVVPCMGIDQAACLEECRGWDGSQPRLSGAR